MTWTLTLTKIQAQLTKFLKLSLQSFSLPHILYFLLTDNPDSMNSTLHNPYFFSTLICHVAILFFYQLMHYFSEFESVLLSILLLQVLENASKCVQSSLLLQQKSSHQNVQIVHICTYMLSFCFLSVHFLLLCEQLLTNFVFALEECETIQRPLNSHTSLVTLTL